MPQKVLKFTGINRKVNEFQNSGACEELINLRHEIGGGFHVVKNKISIRHDIEYDLFFEHSWGAFKNYIIVEDGDVYWTDSLTGDSKLVTNEFERKKVSLSSAGNVLVIYCSEKKRQLVYKFEDGKYEPFEMSLPQIKNVRVSYAKGMIHDAFSRAEAERMNMQDMNAALQSAISKFYTSYQYGLCGATVVGCTYELEDGTEIWSTAFLVANVTRTSNYRKPEVETEKDANNDSHNTVVVWGTHNVTVSFSFDTKEFYDKVKKINVYAAKPMFPYELVETSESKFEFNELSLDELSLAGQLMYYQGSVTPEAMSITLKLGADMAAEKVMEVTAGCIERVGDLVSYNNRFHYFRSDVDHIIQTPTVAYSKSTDTPEYWVSYVKFNDEWKLVNNVFQFASDGVQDFIYPMAGIKKLAFVKAVENENGDISVPFNDMFYVDLKDSTAYNYSYALAITPKIVQASDFEETVTQAGQTWGNFDTKVKMKSEANAINVSAPYNPYVFQVNHSYSFSGEIKDICTSYLPVSSVQIGQYPLTVFTDNGIFAMEQGSGQVLYGNTIPLQPHVIEGHATSTPYGTFFISSKDLYLLSGREAVNVSSILHGEREMNLQEIDSWRALCLNEKGSEMLYDYRYALSDDDEGFDVIISGSRLVYDQLNNELYICSDYNNLKYSYVFNIDTKAYHKVSKKYIAAQSNSRYVIEIDGDMRRVVDLHNERRTSQPILIQSRPFSLEAFYSHIQRMIMMVDARLAGNQHVCLSVFGSDNLYDWKCIISSQKKDAVLRQIRTNKAPKSYKDYVILVTGIVNSDTDISDIIADYTIVKRRLG